MRRVISQDCASLADKPQPDLLYHNQPTINANQRSALASHGLCTRSSACMAPLTLHPPFAHTPNHAWRLRAAPPAPTHPPTLPSATPRTHPAQNQSGRRGRRAAAPNQAAFLCWPPSLQAPLPPSKLMSPLTTQHNASLQALETTVFNHTHTTLSPDARPQRGITRLRTRRRPSCAAAG